MGPDRPQFDLGPANFATYRFGAKPVDRTRALHSWRGFIDEHMPAFQETWSLLADDESRAVLLECLTFNAFGWQQVRRARDTSEYQALIAEVGTNARPTAFPIFQRDARPIRHKLLHLHHLKDLDLKLVTSDGFFINVMQDRQYFLERDHVRIQPERGDVVLDCGAGWGDTSMLFCRTVRPQGKVVGFEFTPSNLAAIRHHFVLNPDLEGWINIITRPLGDRSGTSVAFDDMASSTRTKASGSHRAETRSIDDVVRLLDLSRVEFVKMDIEGAEGGALQGAVHSLRKFGPRLAISAYHRPSDLLVLPKLIKAIRPDYALYLDHHTIHHEETVLYAVVQSS